MRHGDLAAAPKRGTREQLRQQVAKLTPEQRQAILQVLDLPDPAGTVIYVNRGAVRVLRADRHAARALPTPSTRVGVGPARPRERRERRHVAQSTSSADPGGPDPASRPAATQAMVA